jgi:hypothetical protein
MGKVRAQESQMRMVLNPACSRSLLLVGEARSFLARWRTWRKMSAAEGGQTRVTQGAIMGPCNRHYIDFV